jgi:hypothetical protein
MKSFLVCAFEVVSFLLAVSAVALLGGAFGWQELSIPAGLGVAVAALLALIAAHDVAAARGEPSAFARWGFAMWHGSPRLTAIAVVLGAAIIAVVIGALVPQNGVCVAIAMIAIVPCWAIAIIYNGGGWALAVAQGRRCVGWNGREMRGHSGA